MNSDSVNIDFVSSVCDTKWFWLMSRAHCSEYPVNVKLIEFISFATSMSDIE